MKFVSSSVTALFMVVGLQTTDLPKQPKQSDLVTVRGCLHGQTLTTTVDNESGFQPGRFQLSASREVSALLKQHTGHLEEVTGLLKAGKGGGSARLVEKRGSKGRIYVGAGTRTSAVEYPAPASVIEVRNITHLENRCS